MKEVIIIQINKEQIIKLLYKCAKEFDENLANKRVMFIVECNDKTLDKQEMFFPTSVFYHLTGIVAKDNNGKEYSANKFYNDLISGAINSNRLYIKDNTTNLKLDILNRLIYLDKNAKIIGDYSSTKIYLQTQKLLGGVNSCMGFVRNKNYAYYIPNTILKEDIRNITINRGKIIAIFKRKIHDKNYTNITYLKKDYKLENILNSSDINRYIDAKNLYSKNNIL